MSDDQRESDPKEAFSQGANAGWTALGLLISGMLVWGGIGWLVDWWLGTRFATPTGVVLGAAGGIYLVFRRYSSFDKDTSDKNSSFDKQNPPPEENESGKGPHT